MKQASRLIVESANRYSNSVVLYYFQSSRDISYEHAVVWQQPPHSTLIHCISPFEVQIVKEGTRERSGDDV
jgi:hypothetical protein